MVEKTSVVEKPKLTREAMLVAKLAKFDAGRKAVLDEIKKQRIRARSLAQGAERKRRSRALILIGASCELAIKADPANLQKVKALVMKHLTKEGNQALVNEYLLGFSTNGSPRTTENKAH